VTSRASKRKNTTIFSNETGLCFRIGQGAGLSLSLNPLDKPFGVQQLHKRFCTVTYYCDLETILAIMLLRIAVGNVKPGGDEHTCWFEIKIIVEIVLYTFLCLEQHVRVICLSVVDSAGVTRIYVGVESGYRWIRQWKFCINEC
jgi:hypothetical protein